MSRALRKAPDRYVRVAVTGEAPLENERRYRAQVAADLAEIRALLDMVMQRIEALPPSALEPDPAP